MSEAFDRTSDSQTTIFEDPLKAGRVSPVEMQDEEGISKNLQGLAISDEVRLVGLWQKLAHNQSQ